MAVFEYKGINSSGKDVKGVIDAETGAIGRQKLRATGIFVSDLVEEQKKKRQFSFGSFGTGRIDPMELATLYRQLSTLVGAGVPLVESLSGLIEQSLNLSLKKELTGVKEKINGGASFADASAEHPILFSDLFTSMISVGEASGTMDIVLSRMADIFEDSMKLRVKVRGALVYPFFMLLVGAGVIFFLMTHVIPRITQVFSDFQTALPLPTRILLSVSDILQGYWVLLLLGVLGVVFLFSRYLKTEKGRRRYDTVSLHFPVIGKLLQLTAFTRFSRTLATLLSSGVPMLKSLEIVAKVVNNVVIADVIDTARVKIGEGSTVAAPLRESGVFPETVIQMILVGEKSGDLEGMLEKVADSFDTQIDITISSLTSILEPVIILILGACVGFIVISILLPIFEMSQLVR